MAEPPLRGRPTLAQAAEIDERIAAAALESFVAHGFDGTTMEGIAAAAGVTKKTLYARFADKETAFEAVVPRALSRMPWADEPLELPADDLEASLRLFAETVVSRLVEPEAVALRRLAISEAHRFGDFAAVAHYHTYTEGLKVLVDLLETHADAGNVDIDDVRSTAELFLTTVAGAATILADFGIYRTAEEQRRRIDVAVALFLRAIRPSD